MNIVFDLGGVVLTWKPDEIIATVFDDPETQAVVLAGVFGHADWLELDRGTLDRDQAILRAAARTGLPESRIFELMMQVPKGLRPVPETVDLVYRLKENGHRLFCLSNMHVASMARLERVYDFWDVFEGLVISCRLHLVKPEPEIYAYLLRQYDLTAEETVFIDDTQVNVDAAARLGIRPIRFENADRCAGCLRAMGCL